MNGAGHYAEAERWLELAGEAIADGGAADVIELLAAAQAHATLALAWASNEGTRRAP